MLWAKIKGLLSPILEWIEALLDLIITIDLLD
jgi:hypothetical protein